VYREALRKARGLHEISAARLESVRANAHTHAAVRELAQHATYLPELAALADWSLLFLRLLVALVFGWSGAAHLKDPKARGKSLGLSPSLTAFVGAAEVTGALGIAFGMLTQWAALGLILIMLGAIAMKAFVWKTGFWGEKSSGWHYDLLFIAMLLVIACFDGGRWVLRP
jgi:putative oxidoreductase